MTESTQIADVKDQLSDIRAALARMADALARLALLEERHSTTQAALAQISFRLEQMEERRHAQELVAARTEDHPARVVSIEMAIRDQHVEQEKNKARFETLSWIVRGLWAVAGTGLGLAILNFIAGRAAG